MAKIFQYNPDPEVWDGFVEVEIPDYAARVSLRAEFANLTGDNEKLMAKAKELDLKHTKSVSLKLKQGGVKVENLEFLEDFQEGEDVYSQIGLAVAKGPKLGNVLGMT